MYKIKFSFEEPGLKPITTEDIESGWTLLEIALKNDIGLHHNCGGVVSCTTCHIYVEKGMDHINVAGRREADFLSRVRNPTLNSRLSCQSLIKDGKGKIEIIIPDQKGL